MTVRRTVVLTAFLVLASLAPSASASAKPDPGGAAVAAPSVQGSDPLACSVTVVAGRLTRCDYLVAHLNQAA